MHKHKQESGRMNYHHTCNNCGSSFRGFQYQCTCWSCIRYWTLQEMENPHYLKNPKYKLDG
jgi:hypothetical protein